MSVPFTRSHSSYSFWNFGMLGFLVFIFLLLGKEVLLGQRRTDTLLLGKEVLLGKDACSVDTLLLGKEVLLGKEACSVDTLLLGKEACSIDTLLLGKDTDSAARQKNDLIRQDLRPQLKAINIARFVHARGIQPSLSTPQNDAERLSSWNVDSADHVDLFLNGWLVKRKRNRGRGSNSSVSSGSYLSSFESEQSMLDRILMQLFRELHEKEMKRERRKAKARLCGSKKLEWDLDDEYRLQDCFPPGWDDEFRRDFQARKADELGLSKDSFRVNERASRNKKRKHDHSPHHETRSADEAFKKASRNKRTKFDLSFRCETGPADHMFASVGDIIKLEEDHRDPADVVEPPPGISHECKTCGKGFPTGQALGGHMKAQYKQVDDPVESFDGLEVLVAEPVLLLPGLDPAQSQQGEDGDQGTGQVVQPFDLNELPIEAYMQDAHESWL